MKRPNRQSGRAAAAAVALAAPAATPPTLTGYLEHPARIALIFGSFAVLCLPLAMSILGTTGDSSAAAWLVTFQAYSILVGYTHFAITFSIYLNSRNLEYFRSSPGKIAIYFGGPIVILLAFFAIGFFGINERARDSSAAFLTYLFYFALLTKLADHLHVVRQSFGVLQLLKRHARVSFPQWMRRAENAFFMVLMVLQVLTFREGLVANDMNGARFNISSLYTQLALAAAVLLLAAVLCGFALTALRVDGNRRALFTPFYYFLLQTASACLPIYWSALYLASLAMHYVEYHVIMYPRVFESAAGSETRVDRLSHWLRSHKLVFYAVLVAFAYLFMGDGFRHLAGVVPIGKDVTWLLMNLFNGIFMAHFFVEAFVWKFGVPYYRQTLTPLYFRSVDLAKASPAREDARASLRSERRRGRSVRAA